MKLSVFLLVAALLLGGLTGGCAAGAPDKAAQPPGQGAEGMQAEVIGAAQAKEIMEQDRTCAVVDVREPDEFAAGHVPGARLLPLGEIEKRAAEVLPDKNQLILLYCRSGRRSALAAQKLAALGYTRLKDFGGIMDWPYAVEK